MTKNHRWEDDIQQLYDRNWIPTIESSSFDGVSLDDAYWKYKVNAQKQLSSTYGDVVTRHPDYELISSCLTFGQILRDLSSGDNEDRGGNLLINRALTECGWIISFYQDNPYPFPVVGEVQKTHKRVVENIKVLERFLKAI